VKKDKKVFIEAVSPDIDLSPFENDPNYKVKKLKTKKEELPSIEVRNTIFDQSHIDSEIEGFDELDLDMLFMRLKNKSIGELKKDYPKISESKLKMAKELVIKNEK